MYQVAGESTGRWEARLRQGGGFSPYTPSILRFKLSIILCWGRFCFSWGSTWRFISRPVWFRMIDTFTEGFKEVGWGWKSTSVTLCACIRVLNVVRFTPANLSSKQWHVGTSLFSLTHAQNSWQPKTTYAPPIDGHQWLSVNEHASVSLCASVCLHAPVRVSLALPKVSSPIEVFLNSIVPYSTTGHWGEKLNLSPVLGRPLLFLENQTVLTETCRTVRKRPYRQVCRGVPAFNARLSLCLSLWLNAPSWLI